MFERISRFFAGATKQERAEPSVSIPEPVTLEGDNAPSAIEHDRKIVHDSRVFIHRSLGFILMVYSPELFRKAINHDICLGYIYGYIIAAIGDDEELCKASENRRWDVVAAYYRSLLDYSAEAYYEKTVNAMDNYHFKQARNVSVMDYHKNKINPDGDNHHLRFLMTEIIEDRVE
ncbi:TPA: hypothetical protein ACQ49O_005535 [Klebsiella pneumoniae]|jgi:hypothetical protein|uniref:Prophage protein n=24 Tax=Enterobacterales TaxID=91347 RepID=A0ABD5C2P8_ECOLX|nr:MULTISPECIES: hypothetical protein [Enterobacterales]EBF7094028.1 hypothetical protein [Salmonella enterica subsp. enterica serovar Liverpool]EBN9831317.1 hypothetical protein [Salmonella enterica subsp. enterica serovar Senftenberg]EBP4128171.1 hypothetical protein [Salmonella enterica subsp. enterica]EBQ6262864.1 hypothetical protein [Salmonella enterica subsp. enterica serovar Virchow]EBV6452086.1 hypothetical protein [Salmonella enterica subsp. enterica serovar Ohio]EBY8737515.1 hypoth